MAENSWNFRLQTIVAVIAGAGAVGGVLISIGSTLSSLQGEVERNSIGVERLTLSLEQNDSATAQLELRMKNVEKIAEDAASLRRELDTTLSQVKADLAVVKEILQRLEQNRQP